MPVVRYPFLLTLPSGEPQFVCLYKQFVLSPEFRSFSSTYRDVRFNSVSVVMDVYHTYEDNGIITVSYLNKLPEKPDAYSCPRNYTVSKYSNSRYHYNFSYDQIERSFKYYYSDLVLLQGYENGVPNEPFYTIGKWPNFTAVSNFNTVVNVMCVFDLENDIITTSGVRFQNLVLDATARPEDVVAPATFYSNDSNNKQIGIIRKEEDSYTAPGGVSEYVPEDNVMITKLVVNAPENKTEPIPNPVKEEYVPWGQEYSTDKVKDEDAPIRKGVWPHMQKIIGKWVPNGEVMGWINSHVLVDTSNPQNNLLLQNLGAVCGEEPEQTTGDVSAIDLDKIKGFITKVKPLLEGTKAEMTYTKNGDYNFKPSINRVYTGVTIHVKTESFPFVFDRFRVSYSHKNSLHQFVTGDVVRFANFHIPLLKDIELINIVPGLLCWLVIQKWYNGNYYMTISTQIGTKVQVLNPLKMALLYFVRAPANLDLKDVGSLVVEVGNYDTLGQEGFEKAFGNSPAFGGRTIAGNLFYEGNFLLPKKLFKPDEGIFII